MWWMAWIWIPRFRLGVALQEKKLLGTDWSFSPPLSFFLFFLSDMNYSSTIRPGNCIQTLGDLQCGILNCRLFLMCLGSFKWLLKHSLGVLRHKYTPNLIGIYLKLLIFIKGRGGSPVPVPFCSIPDSFNGGLRGETFCLIWEHLGSFLLYLHSRQISKFGRGGCKLIVPSLPSPQTWFTAICQNDILKSLFWGACGILNEGASTKEF